MSIFSTAGMKELVKPKPIKCPVCKKLLDWYIYDDQKHYTTSHHFVWENTEALLHHTFYLIKPRYV